MLLQEDNMLEECYGWNKKNLLYQNNGHISHGKKLKAGRSYRAPLYLSVFVNDDDERRRRFRSTLTHSFCVRQAPSAFRPEARCDDGVCFSKLNTQYDVFIATRLSRDLISSLTMVLIVSLRQVHSSSA